MTINQSLGIVAIGSHELNGLEWKVVELLVFMQKR